MEGGEDLHPLDRIDAEIGIKRHVEFQHLQRIAGLLGNDAEEDGVDPLRRNRCGRRSRNRSVCHHRSLHWRKGNDRRSY